MSRKRDAQVRWAIAEAGAKCKIANSKIDRKAARQAAKRRKW